MALIPTTQVNVSPDDYKRKAAYALMVQGADASPVEAWSQGAARIAQAMLGQYEMNQIDKKDKQSEADATKAYLNFLQPQGGQASPPVAPQPDAGAVPPQMSPVASALAKPVQMASADPAAPPRQTVGEIPGIIRTNPDGTLAGNITSPSIPEKPSAATALAGPSPAPDSIPLPTPRPAAAALAPKPEPAPVPEPVAEDPNAKIRRLLESPNKAERMLGRALAEQAISQSIKPETTDELKEYNFAVKQAKAAGEKPPSFVEFKTNMKKAGKPETTVNVGGGSDKQIFDAMDESAKAARQTAAGLTGLREARNAIQGGVITGAGANQVLGLQKVGAALGITDPSKIVNTETFRAAIAPQVAAVLKSTVGTTNISNTDREFAEKAAGGNITLDEKSIARLLDIMERAATAQLEAHQKKVDKIYTDPEKYGRERALFGVDIPPPLAPIAKREPAQTNKTSSGITWSVE